MGRDALITLWVIMAVLCVIERIVMKALFAMYGEESKWYKDGIMWYSIIACVVTTLISIPF